MVLTRRRLLAALSLTAAGCTPPDPVPTFQEPRWNHLRPIRLAVSQVDVVGADGVGVAASGPASPARALARWAEDRLNASGGPDHYARLVIEEASLRESALPRTTGIRGVFTTDQGWRYDGVMVARLEIRASRTNFREAFAGANATRSRTVPENASPAERERAKQGLIEQLVGDMNTEMERQALANLGPFLR